MMQVHRILSFTAVFSVCVWANSASAALLLSDNFFATGNPNSFDLNFNLSPTNLRQAGYLATTTYTPSGNAQVGNNAAGLPDSGNYLLAAFEGNASPDFNFNTLSTPLTISFQVFPNVTSFGFGDNTDWTAINLGLAVGDRFSDVQSSTSTFSIGIRNNGGYFNFNNGVLGVNTTTSFSNLYGAQVAVVLSDIAGTGSAFGGLSSKVQLYINSTLINTWTTGGGGISAPFTNNYINFESGQIGGIDNLEIVPEPGSIVTLAIGFAAFLGLKRRSR